MKTLLLSAVLSPFAVAQAPMPSVADRSKPVSVALEQALTKRAFDITAADLEKVTELKLPHIHIPSFKDNDFAGLTRLRKLHFYSLLHNRGRPEDPIAIGNKVFVPLSNLEELVINEQLGRLPDGVFSGLTSLKVLDLTNSTLPRLPASLLTLPSIETVYFDGRGMSKEDYETLKKTLGTKLKSRR
ncbi:MAG: hypothetical protein U0793_06420 [Gemmataceae bacterium]|mgnify:CR=1 FL=1